MPLLLYIISYLYAGMICGLVFVIVFVWSSSDYECNEAGQVATALYGSASFYGVAIVVARLGVWFGWRGGPLEESRRKIMTSLLYCMMALWVVLLGFTVFGTYLSASPGISKSCWSNNPCSSFQKTVPASCTLNKDGEVELTKDCQIVWGNGASFDRCIDQWSNLAATWMVQNYNGTNREIEGGDGQIVELPLFNYPGISSCKVTTKLDSKEIMFGNDFSILDFSIAAAVLNKDTEKIFPIAYQAIVLSIISNDTVSADTDSLVNMLPWSSCLSNKCLSLLDNECQSFDVLINLPVTYEVKVAFVAVIYASWVIQFISWAMMYLSYNAFPDYESTESWEGLVYKIGKRFGISSELEDAKAIDGTDALRGLGSLFHKLFGGIDLDSTDVILGLYLVHTRQRWKRRQFALYQLRKQGYIRIPRKECPLLKRLLAFMLFPFGQDGYSISKHQTDDAEYLDSVERMDKPVYFPIEGAGSDLNEKDGELVQDNDQCNGFNAPAMQHSFVRIKSLDLENACKEKALKLTESRELQIFMQDRKFLTPLMLRRVTFDPPIENTMDAARSYLGETHALVDVKLLQEASMLLPIARASYGLTTKKWKGVTKSKWYHGVTDSAISCMKPVLPKSLTGGYFLKRNLDSILGTTGISAADLLYVSYTSTSLGMLPYLILLHRPTKRVCISVRGTVGLTDLITDLLSNPLDISLDQLPEWVQEEFKNTPGESKEGAYAHAGIISSAKSILDDLEQRQFMNAMAVASEATISSLSLESEENKKEIKRLESLSDQDEVHFSAQRACAILNKAVFEEGWKVTITGHSLGAAVSCLLSFYMQERVPNCTSLVFNPPGGLLDPTLSQLSRRFCTSIVVGFDAISRLSLLSTKRIVDDMVFALGRAKRPKLSILFDKILGRHQDASSSQATFLRFEDIPSEVREVIGGYIHTSQLHKKGTDYRPLFPPGELIFLRPYLKDKTEAWDAVWIQGEDLMDEGILLSRAMMKHHLLMNVRNALDSAIEFHSKLRDHFE